MHRRTRAVDIPQSVKRRVYERDNGRCIVCGRDGMPNAHYIARSHGGLGVEQNILTLCLDCHNTMDNGSRTQDRERVRMVAGEYLRRKYPDWNREQVIFDKWRTK